MKEERKKTRGEQRGWIARGKIILGIICLAFIAAGTLYAVMLQTEKKLLDSGEKAIVYVAKQGIPKGMLFNAENWKEYAEEREVDTTLIPTAAIKTIPEEDLIVAWSVDEGAFLTIGMFQSINDVLDDIKQPVLAGFRADDLYQVVGGVLRAGDRIHIYKVDKENHQAKLLWENLYVQQVFDNGGVRIDSDDDKTCAQRVNIYLDQRDVESFYEELYRGEVRVVKVI